MGVMFPTARCAKMLIGRVRNSQLCLGIFRRSFRHSLDSRGAIRYIPKNDTAKSKIAYPSIRNCLRNSRVVMSFYIIEIQKGREIADSIVLSTIERLMNSLFSLYLSARANGVIASGIAASIIELENSCVGYPRSSTPK